MSFKESESQVPRRVEKDRLRVYYIPVVLSDRDAVDMGSLGYEDDVEISILGRPIYLEPVSDRLTRKLMNSRRTNTLGPSEAQKLKTIPGESEDED